MECTWTNGCPYLGGGEVTFDNAWYSNSAGDGPSITGTAVDLEHPFPGGPVAVYPDRPSGPIADSFNVVYSGYW